MNHEAYSRFRYSGTTPGADTNTYVLFSTVVAFPGGNMSQGGGIYRLRLCAAHAAAGTLNFYKSVDRGVNWTQIGSESVVSLAPLSTAREYIIEPYADYKLEWVNGGSAQTTWVIDMALVNINKYAAQGLILKDLAPSVRAILSVQSDRGIVLNGSTVARWEDISGNNNHFYQTTAASQPTWTTNDLNGQPSLAFDGSDDELQCPTLSLQPPGTQPYSFFIIFRLSTWQLNDLIIGRVDAGGSLFFMSGVSPQLRIDNGVSSAANGGITVGSWGRARAGLTNSTSDYLRCGATTVTGTNCGNNARTGGMSLGFSNGGAGAQHPVIRVVALTVFLGGPTAAEWSAIDAGITAKYGSGVLV